MLQIPLFRKRIPKPIDYQINSNTPEFHLRYKRQRCQCGLYISQDKFFDHKYSKSHQRWAEQN